MKQITFKSEPVFSGVVFDIMQGEFMCDEVRTLTESEFCIDVPDEADEEECRAEVENLLAGAGLFCGQHYYFI